MKTTIITGAGTGVGAATAKRLAADGHAIVLLGRRRATLDEIQCLESADPVHKFVPGMVPLGRMSTPEEIADFVAFLFAPEQSSMTGQCIDNNNDSWMG